MDVHTDACMNMYIYVCVCNVYVCNVYVHAVDCFVLWPKVYFPSKVIYNNNSDDENNDNDMMIGITKITQSSSAKILKFSFLVKLKNNESYMYILYCGTFCILPVYNAEVSNVAIPEVLHKI